MYLCPLRKHLYLSFNQLISIYQTQEYTHSEISESTYVNFYSVIFLMQTILTGPRLYIGGH